MLAPTDIKNNSRGDKGLVIALTYYTKNEYLVSIPLNDSQDYDIVVDNGSLQKIQIKTTSYKDSKQGYYIVRMRSGNSNKTISQCGYDKVFIANDVGDLWEIPKKAINHIVSGKLSLTPKYNKYKVQ